MSGAPVIGRVRHTQALTGLRRAIPTTITIPVTGAAGLAMIIDEGSVTTEVCTVAGTGITAVDDPDFAITDSNR